MSLGILLLLLYLIVVCVGLAIDHAQSTKRGWSSAWTLVRFWEAEVAIPEPPEEPAEPAPAAKPETGASVKWHATGSAYSVGSAPAATVPDGLTRVGPVPAGHAAEDASRASAVPAMAPAEQALCEADREMAGARYGRAAAWLRSALASEPERRDLQLKLLEVFFMSGNRDEFLATARGLRERMGEAADRDWDKVLIMGKQICPDAALFSTAAATTLDVDVALDRGESTALDIFFDDGGTRKKVDLDVGGVEEDAWEETVREPVAMAGSDTVTEQPVSVHDVDLGVDFEAQSLPDLDDELRDGEDMSSVLGDAFDGLLADELDEPAGPELDLDLPELNDALEDVFEDSFEEDEAERTAALDDIEADSLHGTATDVDPDLASTAITQIIEIPESDDLDDADEAELEEHDGMEYEPEHDASSEIDKASRTMTDVGTKLDLARAYMDIGDPDQAKGILEEVLQEGTSTQRKEAHALIADIGG